MWARNAAIGLLALTAVSAASASPPFPRGREAPGSLALETSSSNEIYEPSLAETLITIPLAESDDATLARESSGAGDLGVDEDDIEYLDALSWDVLPRTRSETDSDGFGPPASSEMGATLAAIQASTRSAIAETEKAAVAGDGAPPSTLQSIMRRSAKPPPLDQIAEDDPLAPKTVPNSLRRAYNGRVEKFIKTLNATLRSESNRTTLALIELTRSDAPELIEDTFQKTFGFGIENGAGVPRSRRFVPLKIALSQDQCASNLQQALSGLLDDVIRETLTASPGRLVDAATQSVWRELRVPLRQVSLLTEANEMRAEFGRHSIVQRLLFRSPRETNMVAMAAPADVSGPPAISRASSLKRASSLNTERESESGSESAASSHRVRVKGTSLLRQPWRVFPWTFYDQSESDVPDLPAQYTRPPPSSSWIDCVPVVGRVSKACRRAREQAASCLKQASSYVSKRVDDLVESSMSAAHLAMRVALNRIIGSLRTSLPKRVDAIVSKGLPDVFSSESPEMVLENPPDNVVKERRRSSSLERVKPRRPEALQRASWPSTSKSDGPSLDAETAALRRSEAYRAVHVALGGWTRELCDDVRLVITISLEKQFADVLHRTELMLRRHLWSHVPRFLHE